MRAHIKQPFKSFKLRAPEESLQIVAEGMKKKGQAQGYGDRAHSCYKLN